MYDITLKKISALRAASGMYVYVYVYVYNIHTSMKKISALRAAFC